MGLPTIFGLLQLLLALQPAYLSATPPVAIFTGQQFADAVVQWGTQGGDTTLVISVPLLSLHNATWPSISAYPPPSNTPGAPWSSGHLLITSADPARRSVIDAANRATLMPYSTGTATFTLDNIVFINMCAVQLNRTSISHLTQQPVVSTYTSALYFGLMLSHFPVQVNPVQNTLAYTTQADLAGAVYGLLMVRTTIPPLVAATKHRTEIMTVDMKMFYTAYPYSVLLAYDATSAESNNTVVSVRMPGDPLLQQLRAQNMFMQPQYCNGTALPAALATGDVDPAEGPLWLADNTTAFIQSVAAASALTSGQALVAGLPPAVLLTGNVSLSTHTEGTSTLPWDVWYPLLLAGPFDSTQQEVVKATVDFAAQQALFVLHPPAGQLAVQGLVLKGLRAASSHNSTDPVPSAFPLPIISIANSSNSSSSMLKFWSRGNGDRNAYTPVWLSNVTLVLGQTDFLALATLALAGLAAAESETSMLCLDTATAQRAAYLASHISTLLPEAPPADRPDEVVLTAFEGWGISGTAVRSIPDFPLQPTISLAACREAMSDKAMRSSSTGPQLSTTQVVGLSVGLTVGVLLLAACVLLLWAHARKRDAASSHLDKSKAGKLTCASEQSGSTAGICFGATADATVPAAVEACTSRSALLLNVQRKTAEQTALLEINLTDSVSNTACSAFALPGSNSRPSSPAAKAMRLSSQPSLHEAGTSARHAHQQRVPQVPSSCEKRDAPCSGNMLQPQEEIKQLAAALSSTGGIDKVTVRGMLGQGASGTVFYGTWRSLPVALKTIVLPAGHALQRAVMETAIAASVGHPNVVATYHYDFKPIAAQHDSWSDGDLQVDVAVAADHPDADIAHASPCGYKLFLVQELCAASLSDALEDGLLHDPLTQQVHQGEVLSILSDIICGLAYLHSKGIVHADLKPCNVLLKAERGTSSTVIAKMADFGLSVHMPQDRSHMSNFTSGTPFYVAPEVVLKKQASPASDIYSLGVVMWQVYTGKEPYIYEHEDAPPVWNPSVGQFSQPNVPPLAFQQLVRSCLQLDPSLRPTAIQAFNTLTALQQGLHKRSRSLLGNAF